jgi:uncharacterized membrane protein
LGARLTELREDILSSLWFLPSILVLAGSGLAIALVSLEGALGERAAERLPLLFGAGPDGARGMLTAIATSVLALAGITFSSTLVALSLTASAYTPRVLRNFMSDRGNQIVLGTLLATFVYSLLVLRTIRAGEGNAEFVPTLAVTAAVLLGLVDLGIFIYFVHHIAESIQVPMITAGVARETKARIDHLFPESLGRGPEEVEAAAELTGQPDGKAVPSPRGGYVLGIDTDELIELTSRYDLTLRMERGVGEWASEGSPLVTVAPGEKVSEEIVGRIQGLFGLGKERTLSQDAEFGLRQLVDLALKALSPGVNDVTTAVTCIDHLGDLLRRLTGRRLPSSLRYDDRGRLRVIARVPTYERLVGVAFDQIRSAGRSQTAIMVRMLEVLEDLAQVAETPRRRGVLVDHANLIASAAGGGIQDPSDRDLIDSRLDRLRPLLRDAGVIRTLQQAGQPAA